MLKRTSVTSLTTSWGLGVLTAPPPRPGQGQSSPGGLMSAFIFPDSISVLIKLEMKILD